MSKSIRATIFTLSSTTGAISDGQAANTITASLLDNDSWEKDVEVTFEVSGTATDAVFSNGARSITDKTNARGECSVSISSKTAETVRVFAYADFIGSPTDSTECEFIKDGGGTGGTDKYTLTGEILINNAEANGTDNNVARFTLLNDGQPIALDRVEFSSLNNSSAIFTPTADITDVNGHVDVSVTNTVAETVQVKARAMGANIISNSVIMTFSGASANNLPKPSVVEATGSHGSILTKSDYYRPEYITVRVPAYDGMKAGDTISVQWHGRVYYSTNITTVTNITYHDFKIPRVEFIDSIGKVVWITYSVKRSGTTGIVYSPPFTMYIEKQSMQLPAPVFSNSAQQVRVSYTSIKVGDSLRVRWVGVTERDTDEFKVTKNMDRVDFDIPSSWISENKGKIVSVNYSLLRNRNENLIFSQILRLYF